MALTHLLSRPAFRVLGVAAMFAGIVAALPAQAQTVIRDAEIEALVADYADPIFAAAGLSGTGAEVVLLGDNSINAFVMGGQTVYIHTGLLRAADTPDQVIGVIAHETGHITAGHVSRIRSAAAQATVPMILTAILGAAAAAAGAGPAAAGIMSAGQQFGVGQFLRYSRTQEASADQAAANYLEAANVPLDGLIALLQTLADQNVLGRTLENSYALTHPLSRERIALLERRAEEMRTRATPALPSAAAALQLRHDRMRAKITGFLESPQVALNRYPQGDNSIPARYARAVAYHRTADYDAADREIGSLIAQAPADPYFHELKGQMLLERGKVQDAVEAYRAAAERAPDAQLIRIALGQALIRTEDRPQVQEGLQVLEAALRVNPDYTPAWRTLANGYDRIGDTARAQLATAERLVRENKIAEAKMQAARAMRGLPNGSPAWLRAADIESMVAPEDPAGRNR
ncbi:M48 family metalloprotease [Futiania mangrovi]|uniref:M48 family metalloprotease n=1 Tax=Futiania mangrovi TaxID=2959716 RepID=A0A9J6PB49_9PROT|nr:M48 family metalloprotease [Futiania mangrovii]MCP1335681.1 M48 family metalloprotease [Futiania mangrovii]